MAGFVAVALFVIVFIAAKRLWVALLVSLALAGAIGSNAPPQHPATIAAPAAGQSLDAVMLRLRTASP